MSNNKPTLRDLAKHLGIALSTVSMSLNDHPRISKETRSRVKTAAKELGYIPDPRVASVMGYLKRKRSDKPTAAMAYVTIHPEEIQLEMHPVYHNYLLGARERAAELGYRIEYFNMKQESLSGQRLTKVLLSRGIEGVIIPPTFSLNESLNIDYDKFASIAFGYSLEHKSLNRIALSHYAAVFESLSHINSKGYNRIGFVMEMMKERVQHRWKAAHLMFLDIEKKQAKIPALDIDYDRDSFLKWFFKYKPTALLSQRVDWTTYLYDEGLTCGVDYGFATLAKDSVEHDINQLPYPELRAQLRNTAGLNQNTFYTGRYAVEFLAQEIALNHKGLQEHPKTTLIQGTWEEGKTLPKAKPNPL